MNSVSVIGLGYVGLPVALLCAEKGIKTVGVDIEESKVSLLAEGKSPIDDETLTKKVSELDSKISFSTDFKDISASDVVIVCVPTPIDKEHKPNLDPLIGACESVASNCKEGALVLIESTIFPGTTEEIIQPIFDKAGKKILLAHCPERIDPGNKKYGIANLPRVVAGVSEDATKKSAEFYRSIIDADITELSSVKAAEATKIMENTFRDINIAFINEMAMSFDKAGIDITEVIKGASTKPFAFMPHYPGAGVGGHCIPVDPYYLIEKAKQIGFSHKFLSLAREINENMPTYAVELLEKQVNGNSDVIVGVLGMAYKANVDDTRESPALKIIDLLKGKNMAVEMFDPYLVDSSSLKSAEELLEKSDYVIVATDHSEFVNINPETYKEKNVKGIVDGRNCLDKEKIKSLGILYNGIGRT